jgi:hypothetical protein
VTVSDLLGRTLTVSDLPGGARLWALDVKRALTRATLGVIALLALAQLIVYLKTPGRAGDFHLGIWQAGSAFLDGRSPYPPAVAHRLLVLQHAFMMPPPIAALAAPFSLLPFPVALTLWNLVCVGALCLALRVVEVDDRRIYLLAVVSVPMWDSIANGQPDALFALAAALTWRYRDSWRGGLAAGALIAAKLLAWPLVIWLLVTRRFRTLGVAIASAIAILVLGWACIGFKDLTSYPGLLAADARAFESFPLSYSLYHALAPLSLSGGATRLLAVVVALVMATATISVARGGDEGWFAAALTFGLLSSPIVWRHYLVVLFVPIAFIRRRSLAAWLVTAYSSWLVLLFVQSPEARVITVLLTTITLVAWAASTRRRSRSRSDDRSSIVEPGTGRTPMIASVRTLTNWSTP